VRSYGSCRRRRNSAARPETAGPFDFGFSITLRAGKSSERNRSPRNFCAAPKRDEDGSGSNSISVAALVDTNILVYRFDPRFPEKQEIACALLRRGIEEDSIRVPHQAIIEFVAAATRPLAGDQSLLSPLEARREAEEFLAQFTILYPNEALLRLALRGAAAYQLSWFDAHLWAYAEYYSLQELLSEDFQHDRLYGTVKAVNPFL
jgi:predicted nucleic acid-binding protein